MPAKKESTVSVLKKQIKEKSLFNVYLFWGDEIFIKDFYINQIKPFASDGVFPEFNEIKITKESHTLEDIDAAFESYPMMSSKKFIWIKDSGIFKAPKEDVKSFWLKRLENVPDYVFLLFDEKEVDKRSALYKAVSKCGMAVEFEYLNEADLLAWVQRECTKSGKKISKENAIYFISLCNEGISYIKNELDKLISFCDEEICKSDIDRIVSKSLQIKIFEITDSIMENNVERAVTILSDLKTMKEASFKILYLLSATFDKILKCKLLLDDGLSYSEIAEKIGVPSFIARKYFSCAKNFDEEFLIDRITKVADIDFSIKQGAVNDWTALEQYVAECTHAYLK
ncbi:MAG: DNA polymerase III subunit delta [Clostridia bacterium]|nr:DNA polymerase III subunit delta [Clostridia bacterium]